MPGVRALTVVVVPEPVVEFPPGYLVSVHVPLEGNPESAILPVDTEVVG